VTWDPPGQDQLNFQLGDPVELLAKQRRDEAILAQEASRLAGERLVEAVLGECEANILATPNCALQTTIRLEGGRAVTCHLMLHPDHTWSLEP
jgi:hypothetical protein